MGPHNRSRQLGARQPMLIDQPVLRINRQDPCIQTPPSPETEEAVWTAAEDGKIWTETQPLTARPTFGGVPIHTEECGQRDLLVAGSLSARGSFANSWFDVANSLTDGRSRFVARAPDVPNAVSRGVLAHKAPQALVRRRPGKPCFLPPIQKGYQGPGTSSFAKPTWTASSSKPRHADKASIGPPRDTSQDGPTSEAVSGTNIDATGKESADSSKEGADISFCLNLDQHPELWRADSPRHVPLWKHPEQEDSLDYLLQSTSRYHAAETERQKKRQALKNRIAKR
eukprot:gnl/MRDRNA2_/MRDRNA2_82993_c0_seq3.p1 gnl/MRDRNA2_/MRDRNA2_82993_c0~~gnl/MRDRNA2_/MRDRNA2_82993_c0_seq3.p1  ORF type:complete len:299 (-),score=47.52 gnl/MRDRNA2_/MRDRNA2_82993_c0_seq3:31-882(-)